MNIRKILYEHIYIDKRTDLAHRLTTKELDGLCGFFQTCQENEDYDDFYLHTVADNTIKRRLHIK